MRSILKKFRTELFLTTLYVLAYFPLLLQRSAYWDGWILYTQFIFKDYAWEYALFAPWRNYHHYYTFRVLDMFPDPVLAGKTVVFVSWLVAGLLLFRMLRDIFKLDVNAAALITGYFLIYPVFIVRFEFIHIYYSAAILFFTTATYIYLKPKKRHWITQALLECGALTLFVLAFFVNSFLFFYYGFLAAHTFLYHQRRAHHSIGENFIAWLKRFFYLPLLPVAYMVTKVVFFPMYGPGIGYNRILLFDFSVANYALIIDGLWGGLYAGFLWPFVAALQLLERKYFALTLCIAALAVYFVFRRLFPAQEISSNQTAPTSDWRILRAYAKYPQLGLIVLGVVFLFLGLFPYAIVGKYPHIHGYGFGLRHSLLMPLGSALFLYGAIELLIRSQWRRAHHIALLSLSVAFLWYNFFLLDMDWYKQQAIIAKIPEIILEIQPPATLVFSDATPGYDWLGRNASRQDYDGYLEYSAGHREYQGVSYFDYFNSPLPEELAVRDTRHIHIISARNWDEPIVTEWLYLKRVELFQGSVRLREAASKTLQIELIDYGSLTTDDKEDSKHNPSFLH